MKKLQIMSVAFVLSASLSTIAYAEEVSATANVSVTAKIDALRAQKEAVAKNAQLEKQKMEMLRASTTAKIEAGKIMLQAKLASTTARLEEKREEMKNKLASTTARVEMKKEEMKERREEMKSDIELRIGKKLDEQRTKIAQRFEDALKSLHSLVTRIESRIAKMSAEGKATTEAKAALSTTVANIQIAETETATLEVMLSAPISTSTRKETIAAIKTQTEKAKNAIQTAQKSLMRIIPMLAPGQIKATSTTSVKTAGKNTEVHSDSSVQQ